jgi:hypothetical protein
MKMTEQQMWNVATKIPNETEIRTWSRENGFNLPFRIADTSPKSITIYSATIKKERKISKREFLDVAAGWSAYQAGEGDRGTDLSQNTSYIFGILKWMEESES